MMILLSARIPQSWESIGKHGKSIVTESHGKLIVTESHENRLANTNHGY